MAESTDQNVLVLRTLLDTAPRTAALKDGLVSSPLIKFDFADVKPVTNGFRGFVNEQKFDFGELAIITYLQAKIAGKSLVLLPAVIVGGLRHSSIIYNEANGHLRPEDLVGRRVGIRSYTQTTGAWVRGILQDEYGVDLNRVKWICFEDAHESSYREPVFVKRAEPGKKLLEMLLAGELDAAVGVGAAALKDTRLRPLIPDPKVAELAWYERHKFVPINHMAVVTTSLSSSRPDVVKELFRLLSESKKVATQPGDALYDPAPFGVEPNRKSLEMIIKYAVQQQLIPRHLEVDELFDDTTRSLGL